MRTEDMLFFTAVPYEKRSSLFDDQACRGLPHLSGLMKADGQRGVSSGKASAQNEKICVIGEVDSQRTATNLQAPKAETI